MAMLLFYREITYLSKWLSNLYDPITFHSIFQLPIDFLYCARGLSFKEKHPISLILAVYQYQAQGLAPSQYLLK